MWIPSEPTPEQADDVANLMRRYGETVCPYLLPAMDLGVVWGCYIQSSGGATRGQVLGCLAQCCDWFCRRRAELTAQKKQLFSMVVCCSGNDPKTTGLHESEAQWIWRCALARYWMLSGTITYDIVRPLAEELKFRLPMEFFVVRSYFPGKDGRFLGQATRRITSDFETGDWTDLEAQVSMLAHLRRCAASPGGAFQIHNWAKLYEVTGAPRVAFEPRIQPEPMALSYHLIEDSMRPRARSQ
jgi:hypothetical protein